MRSSHSPLEHVAIHEAGHAVVCTLLHRERPSMFPLPTAAWIDPDACRGAVDREIPELRWAPERRVQACGLAMCATAGAVSECVSLGCCRASYTKTDVPSLHRHLDRGGFSAAQRVPLIFQIEARTRELLSRPAVRRAVEAVATELLEKRRLSGGQILAIIERGSNELSRV